MRIFIHYDQTGRILSVAQVESMAEGLEHPFLLADETEGVLELNPDDPAAKQACHEIHTGYVVEVANKRLKKK
jgi:hypothetical protein